MRLRIERVTVAEVLPVRHAVLWPQHPPEFSRVADDEQGWHYALREGAQVVCVASLFVQGGEARLRKFATLPAWQGKGLGSAMLAGLIDAAREAGCSRFWCDARTRALNLYQRAGLEAEGAPFAREGVMFQRMACALQPWSA